MITAIVMCLLPYLCLAHDSVSSSTEIVSIYTKNNGTSFITFESGKLPGCYGNRGAYLSTGSDTSRLYSTVLSAKLANQKVVVYFNYNSVADDYHGWGLCHIEAIVVN